MDKQVLRYDRGEVKGQATKTDEGYVHADAIVTRTGVFVYQNADGSIRRELRHPDDVFQKSSMDSMKMIPITNGHPKARLVNADNAKELSIGHVGETIYADGQYLMAKMAVTHADGVQSIDMGRKELSLGYTVDLEKIDGEYNGERYDHRQRNIRYNHLAIVDLARAGGAARINLDSGDATQTETPNEGKPTMKKVTLDGIEYDAAPEVANALKKATARVDALEKEAADHKTKLDAATAEAEKAKGERDALKEATKDKTKTDGEVREAVKARLHIERVAGKVLTKEDQAKMDDQSDLDLMKAVVKAKAPAAVLDGATEVYVKARFDAVAEIALDAKDISDQRKAMGERQDALAPDAEKAQKDSFEAMKSMHKKTDKK